MKETSSIRPVVSKKSWKNVFDYCNPTNQKTVKVAAFDIDINDSLQGLRIRKRIKADFKTVKIIINEIKTAIQQGDSDRVDLLSGKKARTLLDLYKAYGHEKKRDTGRVGSGISEKTLARYEVAMKSLLPKAARNDEGLKSLLISKITISWIETRLHQRVKEGVSLHTINSDLRHLKALFNWGMKNGYVGSNPFKYIPNFKVSNNEPRVFTLEEWKSLRDTTKETRWYPLILTYVLTGARLSEILKPKLSWEDINFLNNTITLPVRKRDKKQMLPLSKVLKKVLLELKDKPYEKANSSSAEDSNYPFPFSPNYIHNVIKDLFVRADIKDATPHDLRRTFGSYLIMLGFSVYDVSEVMSHSSVRVTEQAYLSQLEEGKRTMIDALEKRLLPENGVEVEEVSDDIGGNKSKTLTGTVENVDEKR